MATMSIPDRTRADVSILGNTVENESPIYPFRVTHKNGYFTTTAAASPAYFEIRFTPPVEWYRDLGKPGSNVILARLGDSTLLTPFALRYYDEGFASPPTQEEVVNTDFIYRAGICYKIILRWQTGNPPTVTMVDVYDNAAGGLSTGQTNSCPLAPLVGDLPVTLGYFPQEVREASTGDPDHPYVVAEDAVLLEVRETLRVTGVTIYPTSFPVTKTDRILAHLSAVHGRPDEEIKGFTYRVLPSLGPGDDGDDFYTLGDGDELYANKAISPGAKSIRIRCRDKYDWGGTFTVTFEVV